MELFQKGATALTDRARRSTTRPLYRLALLVVLGLLALLGAACQRRSAPIAVSETPAPTAPALSSAATATPTAAAPTPAPSATSTPAPSATPSPLAASPQVPMLFDTAWDDRSPFAAGLLPDEQGVLQTLPGATTYHMEVEIADDLQSLSGRVQIRYTNQEAEALDVLYLRLFPSLLGGEGTASGLVVDGTAVEPEIELKGSALRVPLAQPLPPGEALTLALDFQVQIPTSSDANYGSFVFTDDVLALAHFYPIVSVYDAEGWAIGLPAEGGDIIYADSSFYLVRVSAPADLTVVGSGSLIAEERAGDRQTLTMAAGPVRDFYLVASERYTVTSEQVSGTTINSYAFPEQQGEAEAVLRAAVASVEHL